MFMHVCHIAEQISGICIIVNKAIQMTIIFR